MMTNTINQDVTTFQAGKHGVFVGLVISAAPILYAVLSPWRGPAPDPMFSAFAFIIPLLLAGGLSGFIVEAVIIRKWIYKSDHLKYKKGIIGGTMLAGLLALPIGLYSGFILGAPIANALIGTDYPSSPIGFKLGSGVATLFVTPTMVLLISSFGTLVGITVQALVRIATKLMHRTAT
jgi:hypothetical protein